MESFTFNALFAACKWLLISFKIFQILHRNYYIIGIMGFFPLSYYNIRRLAVCGLPVCVKFENELRSRSIIFKSSLLRTWFTDNVSFEFYSYLLYYIVYSIDIKRARKPLRAFSFHPHIILTFTSVHYMILKYGLLHDGRLW